MCHGCLRLYYWTKQPVFIENQTAINVNYFHDLQYYMYQQDSRHIAAQYYITRYCLQCIIDKCTKKLGLWTHSIYPLYHSVLEWLFSLFVLFCFCFHFLFLFSFEPNLNDLDIRQTAWAYCKYQQYLFREANVSCYRYMIFTTNILNQQNIKAHLIVSSLEFGA